MKIMRTLQTKLWPVWTG